VTKYYNVPLLIGSTIYHHKRIEGGIGFIGLDTYSQLIAGADENSTSIGSASAKIIQQLCEETNATGIAIHHSNADGDLRGAKSLIYNQAFEAALTKQANGRVQITYIKLKGSPTAPPDSFKIEGLDFPGLFDEDGRQLSTGVAVQIPNGEVGKMKDEARPKAQRVILALLDAAPMNRLSDEELKRNFMAECTPENGDTESPGKKYRRSTDSLKAANLIVFDGVTEPLGKGKRTNYGSATVKLASQHKREQDGLNAFTPQTGETKH
jgi:hypothetical protein